MNSKERLSVLVKDLRGHVSQRKFAKELGVSFASIQSWEAGDAMPSMENLALIAAKSGYTLEGLIAYLEDKPVPRGPDLNEIVMEIRRMPPKQLAQVSRVVSDRLIAIAEAGR